eukprot:jgi/Psemu1/66299/estExt_Genemark1.C_1930016
MEDTGTPDPFHHHHHGLGFKKESKQKQKQNQHEPPPPPPAAAAEPSPPLPPHESSSLLVAHDLTLQECLVEPFEAAGSSNNISTNISTNNNSNNNISNNNASRNISTNNTSNTNNYSVRTLLYRTRSGHGHIHGLLDLVRDQSFGHEHPVHYHKEHLADHAHGILLLSVALLVFLSLQHSVLEAVAIGAASTRRTVELTVLAVLVHKVFVGYALGSAMVAGHVKWSHMLVLGCVFGACSIVGVALRLLLERTIVRHANGNASANANVSENEGVLVGFVRAVVVGTFLYVAIVEIAMKELLTHRGSGNLPVGDCQVHKLVAF